MKRWLLGALFLILLVAGAAYFFNRYWIHRYDALIRRQAVVYKVDPDLVWSIIYQETYFRPWIKGEHGEVGLMQVRPSVAREWAAETGMHDFVDQMDRDPESALRDPERNIQIACWYLQKIYGQFRDMPDVEARMVAGYNAGPSRAVEWNRVADGAPQLNADQFISRIDIPSTRAYVSAIIDRYRKLKSRLPDSAPAKLDRGRNDRASARYDDGLLPLANVRRSPFPQRPLGRSGGCETL